MTTTFVTPESERPRSAGRCPTRAHAASPVALPRGARRRRRADRCDPSAAGRRWDSALARLIAAVLGPRSASGGDSPEVAAVLSAPSTWTRCDRIRRPTRRRRDGHGPRRPAVARRHGIAAQPSSLPGPPACCSASTRRTWRRSLDAGRAVAWRRGARRRLPLASTSSPRAGTTAAAGAPRGTGRLGRLAGAGSGATAASVWATSSGGDGDGLGSRGRGCVPGLEATRRGPGRRRPRGRTVSRATAAAVTTGAGSGGCRRQVGVVGGGATRSASTALPATVGPAPWARATSPSSRGRRGHREGARRLGGRRTATKGTGRLDAAARLRRPCRLRRGPGVRPAIGRTRCTGSSDRQYAENRAFLLDMTIGLIHRAAARSLSTRRSTWSRATSRSWLGFDGTMEQRPGPRAVRPGRCRGRGALAT